MQWLTWIFLESPLALSAACFVILFVLLVYWRRTGKPRPLLVGLVLAVVAFAAQAFVETRRELADRLLEPVERQAVQGQTQALQALVAPQFAAGELDATEFVALARQRLSDHPLTNIQRLGSHIVESGPDSFVVRNSYYVTGRFGQIGAGSFQCTIRFDFLRTQNQWKIVAIEPPKIQGVQFDSWTHVVAR